MYEKKCNKFVEFNVENTAIKMVLRIWYDFMFVVLQHLNKIEMKMFRSYDSE